MLGNFYILGPYWPNKTLDLEPNPGEKHYRACIAWYATCASVSRFNSNVMVPSGTWNRIYGLLFIDQPVGTGFSIAGALSLLCHNTVFSAEHGWPYHELMSRAVPHTEDCQMQARRGFLQMRWRSPRIFMWGCRNSLASIRICNQGLCSSLANHMPANTCHPSVRTITCISSMMTLSFAQYL